MKRILLNMVVLGLLVSGCQKKQETTAPAMVVNAVKVAEQDYP